MSEQSPNIVHIPPDKRVKDLSPEEMKKLQHGYGHTQLQRVEEASKEELAKVESRVIGRRIKETRNQIKKAYALIDSLLPSSIGAVEKVLVSEMRKEKRDGYLVLSIAKFLASKRLPDVGKIEPEKDLVQVELTLPEKKKVEKKTERPQIEIESSERALRMKANRPVDLQIRQSVGGTGQVVEVIDETDSGIED